MPTIIIPATLKYQTLKVIPIPNVIFHRESKLYSQIANGRANIIAPIPSNNRPVINNTLYVIFFYSSLPGIFSNFAFGNNIRLPKRIIGMSPLRVSS